MYLLNIVAQWPGECTSLAVGMHVAEGCTELLELLIVTMQTILGSFQATDETGAPCNKPISH